MFKGIFKDYLSRFFFFFSEETFNEPFKRSFRGTFQKKFQRNVPWTFNGISNDAHKRFEPEGNIRVTLIINKATQETWAHWGDFQNTYELEINFQKNLPTEKRKWTLMGRERASSSSEWAFKATLNKNFTNENERNFQRHFFQRNFQRMIIL